MSETGEQVVAPQKLSEKHSYRRWGTAIAEKVEKRLLPEYMKQIWQRNVRLWEINDPVRFEEEVSKWVTQIREGKGKYWIKSTKR